MTSLYMWHMVHLILVINQWTFSKLNSKGTERCVSTEEQLKTTASSVVQKNTFVHAFLDRVLMIIHSVTFLSDCLNTA